MAVGYSGMPVRQTAIRRVHQIFRFFAYFFLKKVREKPINILSVFLRKLISPLRGFIYGYTHILYNNFIPLGFKYAFALRENGSNKITL